MIIITAYHGKKDDKNFLLRKAYLNETIASIDAQSYKHILHIIVDDGSTDFYCDELMERYKESKNRVILRRNKPHGEILTASNAINYALEIVLSDESINGLDLTTHDFICFTDSDDLVIDIDKRVKAISSGSLDLLYTDTLIFFDDKSESFLWDAVIGNTDYVYNNFWILGKMPYPSMTWNKKFLIEILKYNKIKYNIDGILNSHIGCGQDVELALTSFECAKSNCFKIGYLPEITAGYRIHNSSIASIRNQKQRAIEENGVIIRHFGKIKSRLLHFKRLIIRSECYFPRILYIKLFFRKKIDKNQYINEKYINVKKI